MHDVDSAIALVQPHRRRRFVHHLLFVRTPR
jgi:hypothetical protein